MWSFYVSNYLTCCRNQMSGAFFVKTFFADGPKTLSDRKQKLSQGDTEWIDQISYFTKTVVGSSSFWRQKKKEVYSWINYHLHKGNGRPTFFITLSCTEYQWKDIQSLIQERMELAGKDPSLFLQNVVKYTNEYSIVVQEYFQQRVDIWLQTVGRKVFHIKHYWIRFEFAPSRGQIHAHMLVICDRTFISPLEQHIAKHPQQKTQILSEWVQRSFDMTSLLNLDMQGNDALLTCQYPSSIYYSKAPVQNVDQFL